MDIDSSKNYARQAAAVTKRTHDTEIPPLRRTVGMNFFMQLKVFVREKDSSGTDRLRKELLYRRRPSPVRNPIEKPMPQDKSSRGPVRRDF